MARVEAHVIQPHEYNELPDLSDLDPEHGVSEVAGVPVLGRPPLGVKAKRSISLRVDPDTMDRFKAGGPGWQTRMGRLLARNDLVLKMIHDNVELIESMEIMLGYMRKGELRMVFEPIKATVARVERNIRNVAETTNNLRDQLVVE